MRIVHVIGYFQPELGYEEYYLATEQARLGCSVAILTSDRLRRLPGLAATLRARGAPEGRRRSPGVQTVDGVTVHRLPTLFEYRDCIIVRGLRERLHALQPDVLHCWAPRQGTPVLALLSRPPGVPAFVEMHDWQLYNPRNPLARLDFWLVRRWLYHLAFHQATGILTCASEVARLVQQTFGVPAERLYTLPLGVDTRLFHPDPLERAAGRAALRLDPATVLLVFAGRLERSKRVDWLLEVVATARARGHDVRLLIIGSGDDDDLAELQRQSRAAALQGAVYFQPFLPPKTLAGWYNAADLGIWPQLPSITIREALGCGLPVVVPHGRTLQDLTVCPGVTTFPPDDQAALVQTVLALVSQPERLAAVRSQTAAWAAAELSYTVLARRLMAVYAEQRALVSPAFGGQA